MSSPASTIAANIVSQSQPASPSGEPAPQENADLVSEEEEENEEAKAIGNDSLPQGDLSETAEEEKKPTELDAAKKFTQLTQQEKRLRERENALKTEREQLGSVKDQLANLKNDPIAALQAAGISFKDLADRILNDNQPTADQRIKSLEQQIIDDKNAREEARLAAENEQKTKAEQEQQEQYDAAIKRAHSDINAMVDSEPDKYELIIKQNAQPMIFEVMQEVYSSTNKVIPYAEAADQVEQYLTDEVERYMGAKKFSTRFRPIEPEPEREDMGHNYYSQKLLEERFGGGLSNDMSSDGAQAPKAKPYISDEESKSILAKKLERMLKEGIA